MEFQCTYISHLKIKSFIKFISHIYITPLIFASEKGYTEIVRLLLSQPGIDVNCQALSIILSFIPFQSYFYLYFHFKAIMICKFYFFYIQKQEKSLWNFTLFVFLYMNFKSLVAFKCNFLSYISISNQL